MSHEIKNTQREALERLPGDELAPLLMRLPARKRLDAILGCRNSEAVVAAMPVEDFFVTVVEVGPDDALPLLALAKVEQLNLVFDVEWWQKADLLPAKALQWLERLEGASGKKLLEWLHHADFELLVSLFRKWVRVSLIQEDEDPLEARETLPPNTLDDQYFWGVQYPQYEALIERILRLLFEANQGFYRELLNQVLWGLEAELQEDAYRFHRGRLEDCSIPDYYDALAIYGSPGDQGAGEFRRKVLPADEERAVPAFALSLVSEGVFLHQALQGIQGHALQDVLRLELASLANKVMVADQLSPDSSESLHLAVHKAAAWVSLGLELASGGDAGIAAGWLRDVYLEDLFRRGYEAVARVHQDVQRMTRDGWIARWPAGLNILDDPWHEAAEHLLQKTPCLLPAGGRAFQSPSAGVITARSDLVRAEQIADAIHGGGHLFDCLNVDQMEVRRWHLWQGGQIAQIEDVTLGSLLWTAAVRATESGDWIAEPLKLDRWPGYFERFDPKRMESLIRSWVARRVSDDAGRAAALAYLEPLFRALEVEMSPLVGRGLPDPKLLGFLLFAQE